jgi:hypothetical protein
VLVSLASHAESKFIRNSELCCCAVLCCRGPIQLAYVDPPLFECTLAQCTCARKKNMEMAKQAHVLGPTIMAALPASID